MSYNGPIKYHICFVSSFVHPPIPHGHLASMIQKERKRYRKSDWCMDVKQWDNMEQKPGQQNVACGKNENVPSLLKAQFRKVMAQYLTLYQSDS